MITGKTYFYFATGLIGVLAVFLVTKSAIDSGTFDELIAACVALVCAFLFFSWLTARNVVVPLGELTLKHKEAKYKHEEAMAKFNRPVDVPALPAPDRLSSDARYSDALKLVEATLRSEKYGPQAVKIISADDAQAAGVMNRTQRQQAVSFLAWKFGVYTVDAEGKEGNGTKCPSGVTVMDIYRALVADRSAALDSAVMALPEVKK
jgi:hypothetical protein